ncbi:MAG TPA: discoidin domain-containing protein [Polyangiaceae bacterium]|nr:discoidin domain-containing protein [Polyangiaceae bacterium]
MRLQAIHIGASALVVLALGCGQGGDSKGDHHGSSGGASATGGTGVTSGGASAMGGSTNGAGAPSTGGTSSGSAGQSPSTGDTGGSVAASGGMPATGSGGATTGGTTGTGAAGRGGRSGTGAGGTGTGGMGTGQSGSPAVGGAGGDVIVTITNGVFWNDTDGNRIEAHGAGLIYTNDAWYWIGEDKSENSGNFKAVNCYRSTDMSHWEFRNAIITRQTSTELDASDRIIERPKVIYNDSTKKYVMWLHWEGANYATAEAGVFTSDTVDGDYQQIRHFQPEGNMSRDDTLFKDDDGKAYFLSAANNNQDSALYLLTDDYTNVDKQIGTLWKGQQREAPAIMKANGTYFIMNSAATNWDPNQQKYGTASAMDGTWSSLSNVGDSTGYDTQTAFIIPYVGSKTTTYIYAGDRWQDPDLKSSKYIWLPLKVNGTKLAMDNYDSWQLDVTTGEWSAAGSATNDGFLSQAGWTLVSVDSEETEAEDGHATNAFDGSTSTYWHTQYTGAKPEPPHEIVIDLGASYSLTSFRYTPRQDGNQNGMVKDYEFYVSDSTTDWGAAVSTGTFTSTTQPTTETFSAKAGRYIRFRGMDEINGKAYTSVAELNVAGTLVQ